MDDPAATVVSKPKPRFVGNHAKSVSLQYPLEWDGKVYDTVIVSPITVAAYNAAMEASDTARVPMFRDPDGVLIPAEIMDALSLRDAATINEVASGFLPASTSPDA